MKKITIILSALVIAAFLVTSCSKDQKSVNRLEGDWKITSLTFDGEAEDKEEYEGTTWTFKKCKVKKGDCDGSITQPDPDKGTIEIPFTYSVSDKGESLTVKIATLFLTSSTTYEIVEQSKTTLEIKGTQDGYVVVQKMEKK